MRSGEKALPRIHADERQAGTGDLGWLISFSGLRDDGSLGISKERSAAGAVFKQLASRRLSDRFSQDGRPAAPT